MKYNTVIVMAFFQDQGIPAPEVEYVFAPPRKWRFDFFWGHRAGVALEVEGGIWTGGAHGRGSGIKRDIEKYNEAACQGIRVLRVTPENLCLVTTTDMIRRCLGV